MRTIKVELTFSEDDINAILESQYFGDGDAPTAQDLSEEQFAWLAKELQRTSGNFVDEIVDASIDADEWLDELMRQFED